MNQEKIRVGVFGAYRGATFYDALLQNNADIVAVCDKSEKRRKETKERLGDGVALYEDFDSFIEHPMDAVLLANYFNEHAAYAIRCLEKNIHVLSECTANATMAEGVALCRAAKKSKAFYMLCENYPFMTFNIEMKRVIDGGSLGKILYAEGEYNHAGYAYFTEMPLIENEKHWRYHLPATYYITHSLAPLMYITGAFPKRVCAMPVFAPLPENCNSASMIGDAAAIITCLNDNDSVFKVTGHATFGATDNSYRFCSKRGQIENIRGSGGKVMLRYNDWDTPEGAKTTDFYMPSLEGDKDKELIERAHHGGGDFCVIREFLRCLRENEKPVMDEYFATTLASVAILAHRSILNGNAAYDIPDFHDEAELKKYENDTLTPFWDGDKAPTVPCCSHPDYRPSDLQIEHFRKVKENEKV